MKASRCLVLGLLTCACGGSTDEQPAAAPPASPSERVWFQELKVETLMAFRHGAALDGTYSMPENLGPGGSSRPVRQGS